MNDAGTLQVPALSRYGDLFLVVGVVGILLVILIPLPPPLLDLLLAINISLSLIVLLMVLYTLQPVDFSVFPSLLLVLTLYRLSLNVASTKLILTKGHISERSVGKIISAFAGIVIRGDYVVGFVIFAILTIIQFVVITKGSGRIAEVAARFTLDAMPMKQMAIDTDLNAGLLDEAEASQRRAAVSNEANFYGAMDGATKFVRGDAIAGLIITVVNIVAGLIVGIVRHNMALTGPNGAIQRYTLLTIGDGLVTQLPSLIISIAAGILISRSSESSNFGRALASQFLLQPRPLFISSGALALLGIALGAPVFFLLSVAIGGAALISHRAETEELEVLPPAEEETTDEEELTPIEQAAEDLEVEPIHLNVGYNLISLITPSEGGDMLNRIKQIRSTLAQELGVVLPHIRIRDQVDLPAGGYVIMIREEPVAEGELRVNDFLAMEVGPVIEEIDGISTEEPTNNQPALWITEEQREQAQLAGYLVIEPSSVLATHLIETIKRYADRLLTRQDIRNLLDRVKETNEVLVEEVTSNTALGLGLIQKVLQGLLKEGVSIRDLVLILEGIADHSSASQDVVLLTEAVRQRLGSQICRQHLSPEGILDYIGLGESVDQTIRSAIMQTESGEFEFTPLDPSTALELVDSIANTITQVSGLHAVPLILCSSSLVRAYMSQFISIQFPASIPVLSIEEVPATVPLNEIDRVELGQS